jgi:hypothetical protein
VGLFCVSLLPEPLPAFTVALFSSDTDITQVVIVKQTERISGTGPPPPGAEHGDAREPPMRPPLPAVAGHQVQPPIEVALFASIDR